MVYTTTDVENSNKFAEANHKIRVIKRLYECAPHLASHLSYTKRPATQDDFYIPSLLKDAAFVVDVKITEKLCSALSCNPTTPYGLCTPEMKASYYYLGTDSHDVQCQPACWHTARKPTYNDDQLRAPDTPMLNYRDGHCRLVNAPIVAYLEKPFYRSDTLYEMRLNDMPTGFSRIESDNPYGCGYEYATNEQYCKYYDRTFEEDGSCGMKWWERGLDAVIGMSLINTIKSSIRTLTNNDNKPFDMPENLPVLPTLPERYTIDGWKKDVDSSFEVPQLIDTTPKRVATMIGRKNVAGHVHHIREDIAVQANDLSPFMRKRLNIEEPPDDVDDDDDDDDERERKTRRSKRSTRDDDNNSRRQDEEEQEKKNWVDRMNEILVGMLEAITTDPNFWASVGIGLAVDRVLDLVKSLCKKIIEKMASFTGKAILNMSERIGAKVLGSALKGLAVRMVTSVVIRLGSKIAIMLAKIASAAASIIGWLLVATMLLDILFTFWDPYGYNNLFPPEIPSDVMRNGEKAFRKALESATCNYEFEHFVALILTDDEMMAIQLESLLDRLVYLDALVVNSEGARIDKGNLVDTSAGGDARMQQAQNEAMAQRVRFDTQAYETYNETFLYRVETNRLGNYAALGGFMVSGTFLLLGLPILAIFFLFVAILVLYFTKYSLQDDRFVDVMKNIYFGKENDATRFISSKRNATTTNNNSDSFSSTTLTKKRTINASTFKHFTF